MDAQKFLEVLGTQTQAYAKLDDIIDAVLRDYVSANPLVELVRTTNEMPSVENVEGKVLSPFQDEATAPETVNLGREKITRAILTEASKAMPAFGMDLVDVRIKRINYVEQVRKKVYERMVSERKRKAAQFRSEGEGKKAEILGQMEKELKSIISGAYRTAGEIRGEADAERPGSMETLTVRIRPSMPFSRPWRPTKRLAIRTPLLFLEPIPTTTGS